MGDTINKILTQSSIGAVQACAFRYNLKYNEGLAPLDKAVHLYIGSVFHLGVECFRKRQSIGKVEDFRELGQALDDMGGDAACITRAMLIAYFERYQDDGWEFVSVEKKWETGPHPLGFNMQGVVDALVDDGNDGVLLVETKTTARLDGSYLEGLWSRRQTLVYDMAMRSLGYDVTGIVYDIVQKPSIRRLKATPEAKRKYKKDGELIARHRAVDESDEEYMVRLSAWYADHPEAFHREPVLHTQSQLDDMARDVLGVMSLINHYAEQDFWPRSLTSCYAYNRACEFVPYCQSGRNPLVRESHYRVDEIHPELKEKE